MQAIPFTASPPGIVLHTIRAAGFAAPPPVLRHADLIPPAIFDLMRPAWLGGDYPAADVRLHQVDDVTVAQEGLVFLPGLDLVEASITQHHPDDIAIGRAAIAAMDDTPPLDGVHVLCIKRGATNYGHWLAEMLPMALLANSVLGPEVRFLVPRQGGALGDTIRDSLLLAGIGADRIVRLGGAPCRIRHLVMVHGLSIHGLYLSPLVSSLLQDLAQPVAPAHPGCRVWVSRVGQARCLWGERDVGTVLHGLGWQVVNPGALPFRDQVALFKGAGLVGGVMGAGLANLLFAAPGTRAEILAPAAMPDTFFFLVARLRALRYRETRCVQTGSISGASAWDEGLVQQMPDLLAMLG